MYVWCDRNAVKCITSYTTAVYSMHYVIITYTRYSECSA